MAVVVMRDEVDYGEPVPRPVVDEVLQLLGYEPHRVVRVSLDPRRVTVITAEIVDHAVVDVMHVHSVF